MELRRSYGDAEPIVFFNESSNEATYTCALVTFPDNHFDLQQGEFQTIALTQPLSTCGYLSVNGLMKEYGHSLEKNNYRYLGTHDKVALAIIRGEYHAGGLKTAVARKYEHMGLFTLMETDPLPAFALVANMKTLSPATVAALRKSLVALNQQKRRQGTGDKRGNIIGNGVVEADDRAYDLVRGLLGTVDIPAKGNY